MEKTEQIIDIPEKPAKANVPAEKKEDPVFQIPNWADNEETVEKLQKKASYFLTMYSSQAKREKLEDDMDDADEMLRLASDQTKQDENQTRDDVDTIPDAFYRVIRAITANETETVIGKDELGVSYEPLESLGIDMREAAMQDAEDQKTLLEYSFVADNRRQKIADEFWYINKYANGIEGMEWFSRTYTVSEKVPVIVDGVQTGTRKQKVKKTIAYPKFQHYDLDMVYLDGTIANIQDQVCILFRDQTSLSELYAEQKEGHYINIGKLTKDQLFKTEEPSTVKSDRDTNANESGDTEQPNGLFDRWHVWIRVPLNDKGEWDDKGYPRWVVATFIGHINSKPICVRINPNPYEEDLMGEIPYFMSHSHWDDKGAYSMGYVHLLKPAYDEYKTTLDQWFDNKNLQSNAPWITERGAMFTSDKTFGPRRLIQMQQGMMDKLQRVTVPSNTGDMQAFLGFLEARIKETAGTTDPFLGQPMGSRTSAAEATNAFEQAMKPATEKLRRMSRLLEWVAKMDMVLWRKYADPKLKLALTQRNQIKEIVPANLWSPLRIKVTSVDDFVSNAIAKMEQDRFVQQTLPLIAPQMGKRNLLGIMRWMYGKRGFPVDKFWTDTGEKDSEHVAKSENDGFIHARQWDEPKDGENHEVHISVHMNDRMLYSLLDNVDERVLQMFDMHIEMHRQLQAREQAAMQGSAPAPQEAPPRTGGEAAGDMIAGQAGTLMGGV